MAGFCCCYCCCCCFAELWVKSAWQHSGEVGNAHLEDYYWARGFNIVDTNNDFLKCHSNILSLWAPTITSHVILQMKIREKLLVLKNSYALANCIKVFLVQNRLFSPSQFSLKWFLLGVGPLSISVENFRLWFTCTTSLHLKQYQSNQKFCSGKSLQTPVTNYSSLGMLSLYLNSIAALWFFLGIFCDISTCIFFIIGSSL